MTHKRGRSDYLYQRPGSGNWYIRLQGFGKDTARSLGTSDRRQAELLALPLIAQHKAKLLAARPALALAISPVALMQPGDYLNPDGTRIIATASELIHLDAAGKLAKAEPNVSPSDFQTQLSGGPLTLRNLALAYRDAFDKREGAPERPKLITRQIGSDGKPLGDDSLFETYLAHRGAVGFKAKEAHDTWALYKALIGKPLKEATRDDGRKLVAYWQEKGLKRDSIRKLLSSLSAAFNFGVAEGKLKNANPFSGVLPKGNDALRKEPFDEADIKLIRKNLGTLAPADQLLVRLVASTGMRLSEALAINGEKVEKRVRYTITGKKTAQSLRRIPLPAGVPAIKGRLFDVPPVEDKEGFEKAANATGKRINKFLRDIGITNPAKTEHSFRHRAEDRLRAADVPEDVRDALLGHNMETISRRYGLGFPVVKLKKAMDKIGF